MEAAARCLLRPREWRADHDRVRAAGDCLGDVTAGTHAAVGDHVDVVAGLEQVLYARRRGVGDRRRLRHADAEHAARRARVPRPDADQNALGPGPHQVQRRLVRSAAADDYRDRQRRDELLQVERLAVRGDMLRRDDGALDDEDVEPRTDRRLVVVPNALRSQRAGSQHAGLLDLADSGGDQLLVDRRLVDLLHPGRRAPLRQLGDLVELAVGVLVAGVDPLEVEHPEAAELAELDRDLRRDDPVHRRGQQRQLEQVRAELPPDVDVLRVAGPPRRNDRDVVEPVGLARLLAEPDLDFH